MMKKLLNVLAFLCLGVLCFSVCGSCSSKSEKKSKSSTDFEESGNKKANSEQLDYKKACEKLDFDKAHQILNELRRVFVDEGLPKAYGDLVSEIKGYNEYVEADIYIFREEVTYLMSVDDPAAEKRILKLIMETPLDGRALDEGYCDYYDACEESVTGGEKVWLYCYCIKRNNQKCDIVMDLAMLYENQSLAKKVLTFYKDNMHIEKGGYGEALTIKGKRINFDGNHGYIWYDSSDKEAAQKRYNEAVKNEVFTK